MELPFAESWKIKMVEPIRKSTRAEREQWIKEAHYNVFQLKAEQVYIDLLTDSGTGAMSDRQWAGIMMGDESYAGARSFLQMKETITRLTGFEYVIPTHQGRAAENVLFSYLVKEGDVVPGNSHFDTTKGHIEGRHATALDCTVDEAKDTQLEVPFKGNVDPAKLERALQEHADHVPFIIVTITNNTAGGQPVSMQNLREVRALADKYGKAVIFDSARFAENAYSIKTREAGYADKTIKEIVKEMFALADGMTMSAKKDAIVNMGGFIATQPNAPAPSPAISFAGNGHTSVAGTCATAFGASASGTDTTGTADTGLTASCASRASALRLIAAAPSVDATALRPCQRAGTRDRSTRPISTPVG